MRWGQLQTGADFGQFTGLFDDVTNNPVPGKRKGSGETAMPAPTMATDFMGMLRPDQEEGSQAAFTWKTQPGGLVCSAFSDGL